MIRMNRLIIICILLFIIPVQRAIAADKKLTPKKLPKVIGREDEKKGIHNGNLIVTAFYNYGCIGNWWIGTRVESGIYPKGSGHSYIAEFTPIVGTEVIGATGNTIAIFSDGYGDPVRMDESPLGYRWGFEPLPGYADPAQGDVAMSDALDNDGIDGIPASDGSTDDDGKPDSWPLRWPDRPTWFDPETGLPFWNGQYGHYVRADQESYFVMNDYFNDEFPFYPDPDDSLKRGIAVQVEARGYQWAHVAAEDILIWTYWITNMGATQYDKMVFGMYGDADVGDDGDQRDDDAYFDELVDIVYQWDSDHRGVWGGPPAYFGYKFLESPGNPDDGIDNDQDGMTDESQFDGIDNDGDWNPKNDDVGVDGIGLVDPQYKGPDEGENNGVPDPGEPNFEYLDNDEADQIGLTSFNAAVWPNINISTDSELWDRTTPGNYTDIQQTVDITFLYGSGYFTLRPGQKRKFAIAMLFGEDYNDLLRNADVMQRIYDADYAFAKPPNKPNVTAVAGDHYVTLYWDNTAENSYDHIYGNDFEGYTIYRATDPAFLESWTITDTWGNRTFNKPIAQFDLNNGLQGPHPVQYSGVGFNMGNDTGLRYSWTDTTVENGQRYFYAICSYDQGYFEDFFQRGISALDSLPNMAPAECKKNIVIDATGTVIRTDVNTVEIVPDAPVAGYVSPPEMTSENKLVSRISGAGTGKVTIHNVDPTKIPDNWQYYVFFDDTSYVSSSDTAKTYSVLNNQQIIETFEADTARVELRNKHLLQGSVVVTEQGGGSKYDEGIDFVMNYKTGIIQIIEAGKMTIGQRYDINYKYFPVYKSPYTKGEELNPFFDGLAITVVDDKAGLDQENSKWIAGDCTYEDILVLYAYAGAKYYQADFEIRFEGSIGERVKEAAMLGVWAPFRVFDVTNDKEVGFVIRETDGNKLWNPGDEIVILADTVFQNNTTYSLKLNPPDSIKIDSTFINIDSTLVDTTLFGKDTTIWVYWEIWDHDTTFIEINHPEAGDVFLIHVLKPFIATDRFTFITQAAFVDETQEKSDLDRVAVVPNPYVVTASWEPQHFFQSGRGQRKIDFIHLPERCTIKIFTMRGYLVDTIIHDAPIFDGSESWQVLNKDGSEIAYGIYIYHIDAPGVGQKIGKFAIIK
ncbi:MAG: hypothetical protein JSW07_14740 [bacterium]|nr:MAG: hypothetical protein JSW07_14740 [bacterium]